MIQITLNDALKYLQYDPTKTCKMQKPTSKKETLRVPIPNQKNKSTTSSQNHYMLAPVDPWTALDLLNIGVDSEVGPGKSVIYLLAEILQILTL